PASSTPSLHDALPIFVYLNLVLLATIVFVPYPTGIFGEALRRGEGERAAAVFYSLVMTFNAIAWTALWLYGSTRRRLLDPAFPEDRKSTRLNSSHVSI